MARTVDYDATLQEDEDEATLDCGCLLYRHPDDGAPTLRYCALHDAAEKLRNLLMMFATCRMDSRCAACNAEIAPEGYCGCESSAAEDAEGMYLRESRILLLRVLKGVRDDA